MTEPRERSPAPPAADAAAAAPIIAVRGLRKGFGGAAVLRGLDLDVRRGESLVVMGRSGSGKSVLIKNIIGLMQPDAGTVAVDGREVTGMTAAGREAVMRRFGMLFQGGALFDSLRVWENVAFGLVQAHGVSRREARKRAEARLAQVGLEATVGELYPAELSGGMQKRVGLARAIATEPDIILFDEPTTGLDPIMGSVIDNLIVKCVRELGATALSITHDMASARRIADRVAMILDGRIIWEGPVDRLDASGNDCVDQFVNGRADGPIRMRVGR